MNDKYKYLVIIFVVGLIITCSFGNASKLTSQKQEIITNDFLKPISSSGRGEMIIDVAKHVLPGTGMTLEEWEELIMEWIEHANDIYEGILEFRQVNDIDLVDNLSSNRTAGAINIYGMNWTVNPPGGPGACRDQTLIRLGQNNSNDTLAHELGHWFEAIPDGTNDDHGNRTGSYPGFPGYSGYDTDGDGDCDEDDTRNIMFPGTARSDSQIDPQQADRIRRNAARWIRQIGAIAQGNAFNSIDNIGDTDINFIDITDSTLWIENTNNEYTMNFKLLLELFVMELDFEMGIYFNSDGNFETGELETGIDYYLGWNGYYSTIDFKRCDEGTWVDGESIPIDLIIEETWEDGPYDPYQVGLSFSLSLNNLIRHGKEGDSFYYYSKTSTTDHNDFSPDYGFFDVTYAYPNQAPEAPDITGPTNGDINVEYPYNFVSNDPEGDYIYYWILWGDGCPAVEWIGPYKSGEDVTVSHAFLRAGDITISAQAKDIYESESDWGSLQVNIPRNKVYFGSRWMQLLDFFPILKILTQILR